HRSYAVLDPGSHPLHRGMRMPKIRREASQAATRSSARGPWRCARVPCYAQCATNGRAFPEGGLGMSMRIRNGKALLGASALVALMPLGCAKQEPPREPFTVQRENLVSTTATVQKVNLKTRQVTLKGEDGRVFTIVAGEEVRNLPQVKVKDKVVVAYHEAVMAEMRPPTDEEKASPRRMV